MRFRVALCGLALLGTVTACSSGNDYYSHDPYPNAHIDPRLRSAQHTLIRWMTHGDTQAILDQATAPLHPKRMQRFVLSYANHPAQYLAAHQAPEFPDVVDEVIEVSCSSHTRQRVDVIWGWFNGAWRAWPAFDMFPIDHCGTG